MSWCDKLASTAGVGFKLNTHFASGDSILDALIPITDTLVDGDKAKFTMEQQSSFGVVFTTEDGFKYSIDEQRISVIFQHRLRAKPTSGGAPVMEMLSRPLPYTELLKIVSGKLIKAALLLNNIQKRTVARVGIISTTQIADEDIPPGISRFIKYVYRPWRGGIDHYNLNITSILEENSGALDRCIHQIVRPEDREKLTTLQFDWQRLFRTEKALASDSLGDIVDAAQKSALRYFEEVAEGSKFDEEILRATAPA